MARPPCRLAAVAALLIILSAGTSCADSFPVRPSLQATEGDSVMVAAANPHAVEAGLEILQAGGSAMDAAVAVEMALTFVEAPETGIGGGGFLVYREAESGKITVYDGRETAPAAARPDRFLTLARRPQAWPVAVVSGRAVGVPGMVRMLHRAHRDHGRLAWERVLEPAIRMAEQGVPMPARLRWQIRETFSLRLFGDTRRGLVQKARRGEPVWASPELTRTLRMIASDGPDAFYTGEIAQAIVTAATARLPRRSDLTLADLAGYSAEVREPLCGSYRQWTVCGAPPPSAGGIGLLQILGLLERFDLAELEPGSVEAVHLVAEAMRLTYADRDRWVGDPAYVQVPTERLIGADYLEQRSRLIDTANAMKQASAGLGGLTVGPVPAEEKGGSTSHFSIVDGAGNAVAMTGSIEAPFGARMLVRGFLLNNQLTDFTFRPLIDGRPHPNAVAPGKRPRSSMSPTIVLDADGDLRLVIGSRGGSRIIAYVAKVVVGVLDWGLDVQQAIALPNFVARDGVLELEAGTPLADHRRALQKLGHKVRVRELTSGLHGIEQFDGRLRGGADPRLEGVARGR